MSIDEFEYYFKIKHNNTICTMHVLLRPSLENRNRLPNAMTRRRCFCVYTNIIHPSAQRSPQNTIYTYL